MKIKLLKDHLSYKEGQNIEVTNERGNYLIKTKVAVKVSSGKEYIEPKGVS